MKRLILFIVITILTLVLDSFTQDGYFYKGRNYGSEATFNPVALILNSGYDMIQVNKPRNIFSHPFYLGTKNVLKNLGDPFATIKRYGVEQFIYDQVLPVSVGKDNAQYWPNYTLHLIGGGSTFAATTEWYSYHKFPVPALFSIATTAIYHFVNEVTENGEYQGDNVDPIADIYLFDLGGMILFSFDNVKRFFSEDLNLSEWSFQPSFAINNMNLHNNGQFYSIKWKFPFSENWHLFYYFGTNGMGGLSYKFNDGSALSFGLGLTANDVILLSKETNKQTLDFVLGAGIFYDIKNSLMAYFSYTKKTDYKYHLNIYPGVIKIGDFSPGLWMAAGENNFFAGGITARWAPFGVGYSSK